ncbi:MAG: MaoC family dehydratase N-terminal domain-containing protein [Maricaulaceae bacterium]
MIDRANIGKSYPPLVVDVEKGQLKFFAKSTAETNPIYTDEDAAKAAGYPALPAPPTFGFSLNLAKPNPFDNFLAMGIDLNRVLHASQEFNYIAPICAGDTVSLQDTVKDIYDKKDGALEFVVVDTKVTNQRGEHVLSMTNTLVVRNG